jgi:hypothetical protein
MSLPLNAVAEETAENSASDSALDSAQAAVSFSKTSGVSGRNSMAIEPRVCILVRMAMDPPSMEPRVNMSISMEPLARHREEVEIRRDPPPVVLVIGAPGTGKSVLARHLETTSHGKAISLASEKSFENAVCSLPSIVST